VEARGNARGEAPEVRANHRVGLGNHPLVGKPPDANLLRGGPPPVAKEVVAEPAPGRVEEAVAVLVVDHSLPWLA